MAVASEHLPKEQAHAKLDQVPKHGRVSKRPLPRPPIASTFAGKQQPKIVYVSSKTHFMSAVKRVEKLLAQTEKRAIQSATTQTRAARKQPIERNRSQANDEIMQIAKTMNASQDRETVVAQGTGKAITRAMQIGLWFQARQQYIVQLQTTSISAVDTVEVDIPGDSAQMDINNEAAGLLDIDLSMEDDSIADYTRIRQLSVLEVHVRLK